MAKLTEPALVYPLNLMEYLDSGKDKTKKAIPGEMAFSATEKQNLSFHEF